MRLNTIILVCAFALPSAAATAQQANTVRIEPGQVCAANKCVRFSPDLQSASIQGRRSVSITSLDLRSDPTVSIETFSEIYSLALVQRGVGAER